MDTALLRGRAAETLVACQRSNRARTPAAPLALRLARGGGHVAARQQATARAWDSP